MAAVGFSVDFGSELTVTRADAERMLDFAEKDSTFEWEIVERMRKMVEWFGVESAAVSLNFSAESLGGLWFYEMARLKSESEWR